MHTLSLKREKWDGTRIPQITRIKDKKEMISIKNFKHQDITEKIIEAAFKVHNNLGSGFLEKVYQNSPVIELRSLDFLLKQQVLKLGF